MAVFSASMNSTVTNLQNKIEKRTKAENSNRGNVEAETTSFANGCA